MQSLLNRNLFKNQTQPISVAEKGESISSLRQMKRILPSLREKKRYIVFEIVGNKTTEKETNKEITNNLLKFLGELTISRAQLKVIKDSWKDNKGIIKVNVKYLNDTKLALGLIKQINNKKVIVNVIGVSGILRKAKQKFMEGK